MRRAVAVLIVVAGLAGCSGTVAPGPSDSRPGDVALRVQTVGTYSLDAHFGALPDITVYADGRVITTDPAIGTVPGPALPRLLVRHIDGESVDRLIQLAIFAGVGEGGDLGRPTVTDAPVTYFTVKTRSEVRSSQVYALGFDAGTTVLQTAGRRHLVELRDALRDLPATLGPGEVGPEKPYVPAALAVLSRPLVDPSPSGVPERIWPGPALPGELVTAGLYCLAITGPALVGLPAAVALANAATPWVWEGATYAVTLRPLLPDEYGASCVPPAPGS